MHSNVNEVLYSIIILVLTMIQGLIFNFHTNVNMAKDKSATTQCHVSKQTVPPGVRVISLLAIKHNFNKCVSLCLCMCGFKTYRSIVP